MPTSPDHPDPTPQDAIAADDLHRLLDGSLPLDRAAVLNQRLATDPDFAAAFAAASLQSALLEQHLGSSEKATENAESNRDAEPRPSAAGSPSHPVSAAGVPMYRKGYEPKPLRIRPVYYAVAGIAAALLVACGLAVYLLATSVDPQPDRVDPNQPGPAVATLIQNTGNLRTPHGFPAEGDDYSAGEYTLDTGTAEFMLTNSVNVKLRGRTSLRMLDDMHASLIHGAADFVVPPNAIGYTVRLPDGSRVLDLGTRFTVWVDDDGRAFTTLREGLVEIHTEDQVTRLAAGETWRTHRGTATKIENTTRLTASADALVSWGLPDRAFGERKTFSVRTIPHKTGRPHAIYVGLIRFDVAELVGDIDSARLTLAIGSTNNTAKSPRVEQEIDVYLMPADLAWDETTITWRSAPGIVRDGGEGTEPVGRFIVPADAAEGDTFELDDPRLAAALRKRLADGSAPITLMVARAAPVDNTVFLAFQSRESAESGGTAPTLTLQTDPRTLPRSK